MSRCAPRHGGLLLRPCLRHLRHPAQRGGPRLSPTPTGSLVAPPPGGGADSKRRGPTRLRGLRLSPDTHDQLHPARLLRNAHGSAGGLPAVCLGHRAGQRPPDSGQTSFRGGNTPQPLPATLSAVGRHPQCANRRGGVPSGSLSRLPDARRSSMPSPGATATATAYGN